MSNAIFSIELRDALLDITSDITGMKSFYREVPKEEEYPYIVINHRRLSNTDGISLYAFEIDLWDRHETESRIAVAADNLDREIDRLILNMETFHARFFKSNRIPIEDSDKQIKRIQDVFQMTLVERIKT